MLFIFFVFLLLFCTFFCVCHLTVELLRLFLVNLVEHADTFIACYYLIKKNIIPVCRCSICCPFIVAFYLINGKTVLLLVTVHSGCSKEKKHQMDKEIFTLKTSDK